MDLAIIENRNKMQMQMQVQAVGGKASKNRKGRKNRGEIVSSRRDLIFRDDMQDYAKVTQALGALTVEGVCTDGITRICRIRGRMRNRIWINKGDLVLVSLREYTDKTADIIHKYDAQESKFLQIYKEIPESFLAVEEEEEEVDFSECEKESRSRPAVRVFKWDDGGDDDDAGCYF